jgi:enoyl reductase-like protein
VAATLNAGYHGELAGGGLPTEDIVRQRIDQVVESMDAGHGITLNLLYLNPRLWNLQFPLLVKLRKQGYPIGTPCAMSRGVCVCVWLWTVSHCVCDGYYRGRVRCGGRAVAREVRRDH